MSALFVETTIIKIDNSAGEITYEITISSANGLWTSKPLSVSYNSATDDPFEVVERDARALVESRTTFDDFERNEP